MVAVRPSVPEDIPAQRELWQLAFGDSDAYLDNFYRTYYRPERVVVLEEDGAVRAMTAWFDTSFVVPGRGTYRAAYLYAVATHPGCRGRGLAGRLLAGADDFFRTLDIPAVTTVPAEPSLHRFFGRNGFRECFTLGQEELDPAKLDVPARENPLRPAEPEAYGTVREQILAQLPHIAYPEDALAYQAGCCALGEGGLFVGETQAGPVCLCAEGDGQGLLLCKELLGGPAVRQVLPHLPGMFPGRRLVIRTPAAPGQKEGTLEFAMLKWLAPALEDRWNWEDTGYLGLAFD